VLVGNKKDLTQFRKVPPSVCPTICLASSRIRVPFITLQCGEYSVLAHILRLKIVVADWRQRPEQLAAKWGVPYVETSAVCLSLSVCLFLTLARALSVYPLRNLLSWYSHNLENSRECRHRFPDHRYALPYVYLSLSHSLCVCACVFVCVLSVPVCTFQLIHDRST
jgi:hypothetical protein